MSNFRGRMPTALTFGTSGLRGLVTQISDLEAYINTRGFLHYVRAHGSVIDLAGDLRPSTDRILLAVARAIEDAGCEVDYLGNIPTPALVHHALSENRPSIMVTGSHIPFDRNGIKFNKADGEVLKEDEAGILEAVADTRSSEYSRSPEESPFRDDGMLREPGALLPVNGEGGERFLRRYTEFFPAGCLDGKRIIVFEHSAVGRDLLVTLLRQLGATVVATGRSDTFLPIDTEDITAERLSDLQKMLDAHGGADAIVSTDGDSDRPLLAAPDREGQVRFFNGDLLGIVVAKYLKADAIAVPISANDAVDIEFDRVTKTRIGSPYVVKAMQEATGNRVVGWEANGGFLTASPIRREGRILDSLPTRDAFLPVLCALHAAVEQGCSLTALFDALPARFSKSGLLDGVRREDALAMIERHATDDLGADAVSLGRFFRPEDGFDAIVDLNTVDGLRIFFANGDVAHIRPSGNAPQLRIYAVANTQARADEIVELALKEPDGILRAFVRAQDS